MISMVSLWKLWHVSMLYADHPHRCLHHLAAAKVSINEMARQLGCEGGLFPPQVPLSCPFSEEPNHDLCAVPFVQLDMDRDASGSVLA